MVTQKSKRLFPFELMPEVTVKDIRDLVREIIDESDRQVKEKALEGADLIDEFRMACDALNSWRMYLRFIEEMGRELLDEETQEIFRQMWRLLAKKRGYTPDDFQSALGATRERTRLPWGYNSLRLAYGRAQRNPVRLLQPDLADAPLPSLLTAIAYQLAQMQERGEPILMPVDSLRALLGQRKLVVGGAIGRLVQGKILQQTSKRYSIGRAREFKFIAQEGTDFELVNKKGDAEDAPEDM
jgi:hypothetical protein